MGKLSPAEWKRLRATGRTFTWFGPNYPFFTEL